MTYTPSHPSSHLNHPELASYDLPEFIDMAPLNAALRGLCALLSVVLGQGNYGGRNGKLDRLSRQISRAVSALIAAGTHNQRMERKLNMLASPQWRARVLRELGGERALARWERVMSLRQDAMARLWGGSEPAPKAAPSRAQLLARAANLKKAQLALYRARFQKACREQHRKRQKAWSLSSPTSLRDRVKVDRAGQFRLAALRRVPKRKASEASMGVAVKRAQKPKIYYSKIDPIEIYPAEFRAAQCLDQRLEQDVEDQAERKQNMPSYGIQKEQDAQDNQCVGPTPKPSPD